MSHMYFSVVQENPNPHRSCVCDPMQQVDCKPPYVVFSHQEMDDPVNPLPVLCLACAEGACRKMQEFVEANAAVAVDAEAVEEPSEEALIEAIHEAAAPDVVEEEIPAV